LLTERCFREHNILEKPLQLKKLKDVKDEKDLKDVKDLKDFGHGHGHAHGHEKGLTPER
jgi:hypothetical protein